MSQGSFQQQPRAFAPVLQTHNSDSFLPPAKRQRIDSAPSSPYSSAPQSPFAPPPNFSNIALPNGYNPQRQPNGFSATPQPSTAPRPGPGVMGPPQRPADRPAERQDEKQERHLDVSELSDLVTASGIDLREEENYLANSYRGDRNNASFTPSTTSAQNSFDLLSQNSFGAIGSQRTSSIFPPEQGSTAEQEIYEKHKKAARDVNESQQHHLENPFLWGNGVRHRMEKIANDNGVRVPLEGLFDRVPDRPQTITGASMTGADGSAIVTVTAPSVLNRGTTLEPILCLLSLAANDRIRGLLEDAYGLARGRQYSSDGVVPPEWSDVVVAEGAQPTTTMPRSISHTPWDAVGAADGQGVLKEEHQALPSPPNSDPEGVNRDIAAVQTVAISKPASIGIALSDLARRDRVAEEARRKLRAARASKKAAQAAAAVTSTPESADGQSTPTGDSKKLPPGMLGERAPEVKMTKKEREKALKQDISDEVATRMANSTASLQLAGMGKSYSWLQSSGANKNAKPLGPGRQPGKPGGAAGAASVGIAARNNPEGWPVQDRKFGEWREDSVGAKGIQMRDWVGILDMDGKERAALGWALMKMGEGALQGQPPGLGQP